MMKLITAREIARINAEPEDGFREDRFDDCHRHGHGNGKFWHTPTDLDHELCCNCGSRRITLPLALHRTPFWLRWLGPWRFYKSPEDMTWQYLTNGQYRTMFGRG
jgi:hypothetical protein